ncbi:MAG: hypothetical protein JXA21_02850 [Anaerolineae bacterium]|nr:hypothetical protein [Anaerolineae bacterium]
MPKRLYALEPGGKKRLEISWKAMQQQFTVSLDGNQIGVIPDQKALIRGQEMTLPDRSTLKIQLVSRLMDSELQILRDGRPLPGSGSDPETKWKAAYGIVYLVAGLNLVLGILVTFFNIEFLQGIGISIGSVIFGVILAVLGFFTQRKSTVALILAVVIFTIDGIGGFIISASQGSSASASGLVARIFLILPMIQGIKAIKELTQNEG